MDRDSISILLPRDMSRRRFNQLLLAGMGTALTGACGDDKALDLFTWSTWGEPGFIDEARAKLGVELRSTFYSSSDEMMAKLRGGGTRIYDMIVPTQNYVLPAVRAGLIEPLDPSRLTNSRHVFDEFRQSPQWRVDGDLYGVPFVWGANAMAFNRAETGEVDSLDALFDPKFGGRIAIRDEPEDTLAIAALKLGITEPYSMGESELQEVKKLLISQKPLVRAYYRNVADVQNMLASGEVVVAWTFLAVVAPLRSAGVDIGWAWPKEGAIGVNRSHRSRAPISWIWCRITPTSRSVPTTASSWPGRHATRRRPGRRSIGWSQSWWRISASTSQRSTSWSSKACRRTSRAGTRSGTK